MNDLAEQLRQLANRGEHRSVDDVLADLHTALQTPTSPTTNPEEPIMIDVIPTTTGGAASNRNSWRDSRLAYAAAVVLLVAVVGAFAASRSGGGVTTDQSPLAPPESPIIAPELTLPPVDDPGSPVTALGNEPSYSYRLTADVEIGWNGPNNGPTQFCWRTPVEEACGTEPSPGTDPIAVAVSPSQTVAIVAVGADYAKAASAQITLDDGSTVSAPIEWHDDPITIGSARFAVDAGSVVSTGLLATGASQPTPDGSASPPEQGTAFESDPAISNPCPAGIEEQGPPGTLYLGGPASDQNLARDGFLFSLPVGTPPVDVATALMGVPVTGLECGIGGRTGIATGTFEVTVDSYAGQPAMVVSVAVEERAGAVGVTEIAGLTAIEVERGSIAPMLRLVDGVPSGARIASVRFKKGDDVWELEADPRAGEAIELRVPTGEVDRFPEAAVDWVLVTIKDADGYVIDVAARVVQ